MKKLFLFGLLAVAFLAFGCGSNPAGSIAGPAADKAGASSGGSGNDDGIIGPPAYTGLDAVIPPGAQAFFGDISNLSTGGFTLTRLDGQSFDVITNAETKVLSEGELSGDLGILENGLFVTAFGQVRGMPGEAPITAAVIAVPRANFKSKGGFWVD